MQCPTEYTADFGRTVRQKLGTLPCTSVHPKSTMFEGDLFSLSPRQTDDGFRFLDGVCAAGEAMGARYYVMHGHFGIRTRRTPGQVNDLVNRMARAQRTAAAHGLQILWENVSWASLRTPQDAAEVRRLLPEQGFVLDVKQALESGVQPTDMIAAMGDRLRHIHVLDLGPDGFCLPGQGTVDWQGFFSCLRDHDFRGAVILEPYEKQARDPDALLRCLDFLRGLMRD